MTPEDTATETERPQDWTPRFNREVRFAVVMYGGVSLAIYIYGVAQELFNLVRATATQNRDRKYLYDWDELTPVQQIYRRLGRKLRVRFIVDILSGTSAGGINAVYLAKALVNDEDFGQLKELWVNEGDVASLINDRGSRKNLGGLKEQAVPSALFNSQRMYFKLLDALDKMDIQPKSKGYLSPYVQELNLSITASDIRGLPLRIKLPGNHSQDAVEEYRYRSVFRFYYSTREAAGDYSNDFKLTDNPFLAFAARCTSSIPPAFEPMRLDDIKPILNTGVFRDRYSYKPELWKDFYKDYLRPGEDFPFRAFGDGGYLDNKPFSYATEDLLRRRADLPVDRKLIYIEPAPEHSQAADEKPPRPDVIENITAALVSLPRYETIREDIRLVEERNRIIEQMNRVLEHSQEATINFMQLNWGKISGWQTNGRKFTQQYTDSVIKAYGPGYALYHNLRVADVLDNFSESLSRALGWDNDSELSKVLRQLLEAWRVHAYEMQKSKGSTRKSENLLVYELDMSWRFRRLYFIQNLIDTLLSGLPEGGETAGDMEKILPRINSLIGATVKAQPVRKRKRVRKIWKLPAPDSPQAQKFREVLHWYKQYLNNIQVDLRQRGRLMRKHGLALDTEESNPDLKSFPTLKFYIASLKKLDDTRTDLIACLDQEETSSAWDKFIPVVDELFTALTYHPETQDPTKQDGFLYEALSAASRRFRAPLHIRDREGKLPKFETDLLPDKEPIPPHRTEQRLVREFLGFYFDRYEYFDMITFPLQYGTPVAESDAVEVVRVSPEDATSLVDEVKTGKKKLAGTKLANFGAFFVKEWRENDILWGRLDGAERLINVLWPATQDQEECKGLIETAHKAILMENLKPRLTSALQQSLSASGESRIDGIAPPGNENEIRTSDALLNYFKTVYKVREDFPVQETARNAARSAAVTGKLLEGLADRYEALRKPGALIARLGQWSWGVVEFAIPGGLPNLFFRHWVKILYAFEAFLIVMGMLLGFNNTVMKFGVTALFVTVGADLVVLWAGRWFRQQGWIFRLLKSLTMFVVALALLTVGLLIYFGLVYLGLAQLPAGPIGDWIQRVLSASS